MSSWGYQKRQRGGSPGCLISLNGWPWPVSFIICKMDEKEGFRRESWTKWPLSYRVHEHPRTWTGYVLPCLVPSRTFWEAACNPLLASSHPVPSANPSPTLCSREGRAWKDFIVDHNETFLKGSCVSEKKDSHRQSCFPNWSFPTSQIDMAFHLLNNYKASSLSLPICKMGARNYYLYLTLSSYI